MQSYSTISHGDLEARLDVLNTTAKVENGQITEYHANVKFAFPVER